MSQRLDPELESVLSKVVEPHTGVDLVSLGLIRYAKEGWGKISIEVGAITDPYLPEEDLRVQIAASLSQRYSKDKVRVTFTYLDEGELDEVGNRLRDVLSVDERANLEQRKPLFAVSDSKTRVLGISSGKGGVGKSSTAVNLAVSFSKMGKKVGLLDADVYGFSVPKMLGVEYPPSVLGGFIVPPLANGVHCMSMGFFLSEDTPVVWRGPMLHKALEQFLVDVYWKGYDFILIDMPPGTGDVALSLGEMVPKSEIYVVTTPQPAAERVAQRSAYAAKKMKIPIRGVVENMSYFETPGGERYEIFGKGGGEELAKELDVNLLGQVPIEIPLRDGGDVGVPVTVSDPESRASKEYMHIAEKIVAMGPPRRYRSELKIR